MDTDTFIYAVIAVVVLARLWTVLGRRNETDKERPNPFAPNASSPIKNHDDETATADHPHVELPPVLRLFKAAPDSLAGGLEQIKSLDPSFDERLFLKGARSAFMMILEDFSKGDLSRVSRFLSADVLARFQKAIAIRQDVGQTVENKLVAVKDVETAAARVEGSKATITVRLVSEQENILRDRSGAVIGGDVGKVEEITDIWIFSRETTSTDPNWILTETRS